MSRKWQRTKQWDREHLTGALTPLRWTLGALSSIRLAIVLLVVIALYGVLASVPIGLLALAPTWLVVAISAAAAAGVGGLAPGVAVHAATRGLGRAVRFPAVALAALAGGVGASWAWASFACPALVYDPVSGEGLRFFAGFVERYASVTLRRLPGFEMTELEFYSWWPLRAVLLLFVLNMFVATVRRIDFTFKNLGVLTVHTGIIVIALGSVYYQAGKVEGDTILLADQTQPGQPPRGPGPAQRAFYDHTRVVLYLAQEGRRNALGQLVREQRPVRGLPRYNDYNLHAAADAEPGALWLDDLLAPDVDHDDAGPDTDARPLDIDVPTPEGSLIDEDIRFRVVGYAHYAQAAQRTMLIDEAALPDLPPGEHPSPLQLFELYADLPGNAADPSRPVFRFALRPASPAARTSQNDTFAIEATEGMADDRWRDLTTPTPPGVTHALTVEVPAARGDDGVIPRFVIPAVPGQTTPLGQTGWSLTVSSLEPQPPFPIITKGYEGATSSVAILRITPPPGVGTPFERWVYHRFPEITQDLLDDPAGGRPQRRDADPAVRVGYLDQSRLQVYVDRRPDGTLRGVARIGDATPRVYQTVPADGRLKDVVPRVDVVAASRYAHARDVPTPSPVPEAERDGQAVGTHEHALVAVEVSAPSPVPGERWRRVVWLPFTRYIDVARDDPARVELPDGRAVTLYFGRLRHVFPDFALRLRDFEMIAYDHRGAPRDYQSTVVVDLADADRPDYERVVKLNAPLRAPHAWSDTRSTLANAAMLFTRGLNPRQFKISQSGWDQAGWSQSQERADRGEIDAPFARFTIMHVGNNPGIHVIAIGGVLMALGIPWAFYVKPYLVRREKRRLAALHAVPDAATSGSDHDRPRPRPAAT